MIWPRPDRYPVSRDFGEYGPLCDCTLCVCNNQRGRCEIPSKAVLNAKGQCRTYLEQVARDKKAKKKKP